jgi:uncharacterized CHY-type Zn-finger protein
MSAAVATREVTCGNCTDSYTQTLNRMREQQCPFCGHPSPDAELVYAGALTADGEVTR